MSEKPGAAREPNESKYRKTVFLPQTDFPMKAGLPAAEPKWLERWEKMGLYERIREGAKKRQEPQFIFHDGPPYANGHAHIGTALNHILKDFVVRSRGMLGYDTAYVPGWDCHGLPIEWAVEQELRKAGKSKDSLPVKELRALCREFALKWVDIQRTEFKRLGCLGDWNHPYKTMDFRVESAIVAELHKFLMNNMLYRGSKPVMWSIVEKTALAEAEIEYGEVTSTTIYVKFPVVRGPSWLEGAFVVIWTTTPWTIPGNRAIAFSENFPYVVLEVGRDIKSWPASVSIQRGQKFIVAESLVDELVRAMLPKDTAGAAIDYVNIGLRRVEPGDLAEIICAHPFADAGYDFPVRLLPGDHVTADTGTGFVHTAPGHGQEDFDLVQEHNAQLKDGDPARIEIPFTVNEDGTYTDKTGFLAGKRVMTPDGKEGDANGAVISALAHRGFLLAKGRLRHQYPHSWRSKAPVIFRNTPQWFISLDRRFDERGGPNLKGRTIREVALSEIDRVKWYPPQGHNRIYSMVENRPDWVLSRQRAWGVPIAIFVNKKTGEVLRDKAVNERIQSAFAIEGADAWWTSPPERFLGNAHKPDDYTQVMDIADVWFDSASTHAFTLENGEWGLRWPADLYLEGSDQHRGWFQSSLLESCGTRGRAPYDAVVTHGFVLDEKGEEKMSKSKGNVLSPMDVSAQQGAEILRLWVAASDYQNDVRFGPTIVQASADAYRKLRNTLRFLLGALDGLDEEEMVSATAIKKLAGDGLDLELFMLHRLAELDGVVRAGYAAYDFNAVYQELFNFCTGDLSAFYLDIRKDVLYCDRPDSHRRRACRTVIDHIFRALTAWLAPILCFTMEEVWLARFPSDTDSIHLKLFPHIPAEWRDDKLAEQWRLRRRFRRAVTGALEIERKNKVIGSSLEAAPMVYVEDEA
ncbi:MAG: isoleucine--tRNA ligase, partial [Alphaproteobacteria bacterium]